MFWLILILWPVAEIAVAIVVAQAIGVLPMLLALIVSWPLGIWAVRSEGRAVMRRLSGALAAGQTPAREVLDGALILGGGALLIIPGFITDVFGLLLLLPPIRIATRALIARNVRSRFLMGAARFGARRSRYDFDSTAVDVDTRGERPPPHLPA